MERRHRIFPNEIIPVIKAVHLQLSIIKFDPEGTPLEISSLFRVLWRFKEHRTGPPNYPEIDTESIEALLQEVEALLWLHNC